MKSFSATRKLIYSMVLTAIFAALAFGGTYVSIRIGIYKIHLGNLVCVVAALLCGPWIGGISGSLGMGLCDIVDPSYGPDTFIRTFIVKFILGFIVGFLFRRIVKKQRNVNWIYYFIISLFGTVFTIFLILYIKYGGVFKIGDYTFKNSLFLVICLGIITLFFIGLRIFSAKLNILQQYVLIATSVGVSFNIVAEFIIKIPFKMLMNNMTFESAFIYATASLPSALITSIITIVIITFIYCPLYFATAKINKVNDLYEDIQKITTWNK